MIVYVFIGIAATFIDFCIFYVLVADLDFRCCWPIRAELTLPGFRFLRESHIQLQSA